ncbi:MAG: phosphoribosyl-AMP cyclohydrolase [Pelagibacterales bacterium]|jgi:phosphoribosyl-AMP cyclohydrolase|nr:phosphoribosyl-AMP cyclohydrolase [Pelagibacterales bacterium]MBT4109550.1 phosphoribosyl-AMP cyclohydrolase [Pelagibacterales bacterium]MBT7076256.1 phosphoribosyl-AMP cyclohydrolase [Pelagibacterales bacterium]MDG2268449.1 phosphoribosyl-AMP cyclohydrolase [Alphaproteobacteria bacterium]
MSFKNRISIKQVEEGTDLAPKFDEKGVIPCITIHTETKEVLMFAYMNEEAMKLTIASGYAHYWSRSRESIWKKGETSGMVQKLDRMLIDDDQDSLVIEVSLTGPDLGGKEASCHVGYRSCFYREVSIGKANIGKPLIFTEDEKSFDPEKIYKNIPNPTKL